MAVFNDLVVKCPVLELKQEPDFSSLTTDELLHGMVVCRTDMCDYGEFVRVETGYGYEGWCRKDGLVTNEWNVRKYINSICLRIRSLFADILEKPEIKSRVICTLVKGSLLAAAGSETGGFTKVILADGKFGYVRSASVYGFPKICCNEELRERIIEDAFMYMGTQYRWGGKTPMGIDCSGLCSMVYMNNGIIIPRDSGWIESSGIKRAALCEAEPGDLLYFKGHIALFIENGRFIHSTSGTNGEGVRLNSLNSRHSDFRQDLQDIFLYVGKVIKK